jgi:DNA ligase-1
MDIEKEESSSQVQNSTKKRKVENKTITMFNSDDAEFKDYNWKAGEPVPYAALCKTFENIENTTKRIKIQEYLTKLLVAIIKLSPNNLLETIYLCLNRICPEYEGLELGIGETILIKAIGEATGRSAKSIKSDMEKQGDLGNVAQASKSNQKTLFKPKPLTIPAVFKGLKEIAMFTGNQSQTRKINKIKGLLIACNGNEPKYLIRSLEGKLRIGLAEQTVLMSIGQAIVLSENLEKRKSKERLEGEITKAIETIKSVYSELPSYDIIIPALLEKGINDLHSICKLTPGIPLKPMLAHPTKSITEVLNRFENLTFTCEYKYDGERAQIHKLENGECRIYSRNMENLSIKYPDIVERIPRIAKEDVTSFVLDCEAVAWDKENKTILPFQVLSTRKRKNVETGDIAVQVCVFAFDCLYLNGKSLIKKTFKERREALHNNFIPIEGEFAFAKSIIASNVDEIQSFLESSVNDSCEGLMIKTLEVDSSYEPSKRSRNWLKVKKDYISGGIGDSLDLVVIGAYTGRGKRTGSYGGYLLACYDNENEEYQSICKIGTGFSDEQLEKHTEFFKNHIISKPKPYYRAGDAKPDIWFDAVQVWEVKCADLSISPVHQAAVGLIDPVKGISLRFPRFLRIRDDKTPEMATTAEQVADMYNQQAVISKNNAVNQSTGVDDDFEF